MDIEERLLRFPPQAALHAWRLFRVRAEGTRLVLSSPMYHDDTTGLTPLWPRPEAEATCHKGHPAPSPGCRCGIYGAVAGTLDSLPGYLRDTAYEHDPWAYAEIACYGRVFVDMRGVRAEHARLVRIALPDSGWPGQAGPGEASRMLRDRYGVPAGGTEGVPQWLTANVRPGGPPPDSESLNLDLARLDLPCRGNRSRTARLSGIIPGPDAPQISPDALTSEAAAAYVDQETRGSSEGEIRAGGRECLHLTGGTRTQEISSNTFSSATSMTAAAVTGLSAPTTRSFQR